MAERKIERAKHRIVWSNAYGPIPQGTHIHHKDGNKNNNAIDNLMCVTPKEHGRLHGIMGMNKEKTISRVRGTNIEDYDWALMTSVPKILKNKTFTYDEVKKFLED